MMKLFPTETEIRTALGDVKSLTAPRAELPKPNFTPPANDGMSQECYDAAYGGLTSAGASSLTRMFVMQSSTSSGSPGSGFAWVLAQRPSADDVKKMQDAYKDRLKKCDRYEFFDSGTSSGTTVATKPSKDGKGPDEGANVIVTSGDVSMAFSVTGISYEKAKDFVKKMAPVMEKRLKAAAPKN